MADKFEDCRFCEHRRTETCDDCDVGEMFEDIGEEELDFHDDNEEAAA
tara:strand:- start:52209 stop:52352 length:144 start_codon:yes stop_codon:yes gene_type:complete